MALKRHMQYEQDDNNTAAECLEEAQPALKRLRLSSTEPDAVEAVSGHQQDFFSRMGNAAASSAPHQQDCQSSTNYSTMNAFLKQLHLEWLQRQHQAEQAAEAGQASGGRAS